MNTPTTMIAEYDPITTALASVEKYRGLVCDTSTAKGMAEAKAAHREVAALRIALDKTRKKVKEDVLARGKLIDGEANRILALISAIEDPIKQQIDAEERKAEEARQAAILAEKQRLAQEEADRKEAERRRLADAQAKLDRERAEFEQKQAEARHRVEAEEKAARERIAAAEAAARATREAEEAKLTKERARAEQARRAAEDEQCKLREAQEAKERAERLAKEDVERKAREKKEAAERARLKKLADLSDGQQVLALFVDRFGHVEQFAGVVAAIKEYQRFGSKVAA